MAGLSSKQQTTLRPTFLEKAERALRSAEHLLEAEALRKALAALSQDPATIVLDVHVVGALDNTASSAIAAWLGCPDNRLEPTATPVKSHIQVGGVPVVLRIKEPFAGRVTDLASGEREADAIVIVLADSGPTGKARLVELAETAPGRRVLLIGKETETDNFAALLAGYADIRRLSFPYAGRKSLEEALGLTDAGAMEELRNAAAVLTAKRLVQAALVSTERLLAQQMAELLLVRQQAGRRRTSDDHWTYLDQRRRGIEKAMVAFIDSAFDKATEYSIGAPENIAGKLQFNTLLKKTEAENHYTISPDNFTHLRGIVRDRMLDAVKVCIEHLEFQVGRIVADAIARLPAGAKGEGLSEPPPFMYDEFKRDVDATLLQVASPTYSSPRRQLRQFLVTQNPLAAFSPLIMLAGLMGSYGFGNAGMKKTFGEIMLAVGGGAFIYSLLRLPRQRSRAAEEDLATAVKVLEERLSANLNGYMASVRKTLSEAIQSYLDGIVSGWLNGVIRSALTAEQVRRTQETEAASQRLTKLEQEARDLRTKAQALNEVLSAPGAWS